MVKQKSLIHNCTFRAKMYQSMVHHLVIHAFAGMIGHKVVLCDCAVIISTEQLLMATMSSAFSIFVVISKTVKCSYLCVNGCSY